MRQLLQIPSIHTSHSTNGVQHHQTCDKKKSVGRAYITVPTPLHFHTCHSSPRSQPIPRTHLPSFTQPVPESSLPLPPLQSTQSRISRVWGGGCTRDPLACTRCSLVRRGFESDSDDLGGFGWLGVLVMGGYVEGAHTAAVVILADGGGGLVV